MFSYSGTGSHMIKTLIWANSQTYIIYIYIYIYIYKYTTTTTNNNNDNISCPMGASLALRGAKGVPRKGVRTSFSMRV